MIILGDFHYKSQKACEEDIRSRLQTIGVTESLKRASYSDFLLFYELCKRHPHHTSKLALFEDIAIRRDVVNRSSYAIDIIHSDGSITEISWKKCITGKSESTRSKFLSALRYSIKQQMIDFRDTHSDVLQCSMCCRPFSESTSHVDHILHFSQLVDGFMLTHGDSFSIPTEYDKEPSTYMTTFKMEDIPIGQLFYQYHLEHASLRIICSHCNLTRDKIASSSI